MPSYRIHIEGQVQGVGFRPYVYRMARRLGLRGWVSNGTDGVHIQLSGFEGMCTLFLQELFHQPPPLARITRIHFDLVEDPGLRDFQIVASSDDARPNLIITPDLGLCEDCRREIADVSNRRQDYAFTTCTHCGPRYSIMTALPYDRPNTTMAPFGMCPVCAQEYQDPHDRRYYSQTNSCPECGVKMALYNSEAELLSNHPGEILNAIESALSEGKTIAVKGIGGYLLMCDATNEVAVQRLRQRKHRPAKPFALLYPSLEELRRDAHVAPLEEQALLSIESPIVLVNKKADSSRLAESVAPGLSKLGIMLPYAPLLQWIATTWKNPLVATSGNISGSPIFFKDAGALAELNEVADFFLTHNREIVVPQDDSVVQFSGEQRIVLRRSRGYAPSYLPNPLQGPLETIFASGSDMKSTFAIQAMGNLYVSQYLGDLGNFDTQQNFRAVSDHMLTLLKVEPARVLVDAHPAYFSSAMGRELATRWGVPMVPVQHHLAHFSAVLAENELLQSDDPVLGVIWDGTGWGSDGQVWGGEFFRWGDGQFVRCEHLPYFDHVLGDKLSREPRLSALSVFGNIGAAESVLREKFTAQEWTYYQALLRQPGHLQTSSVGRLFDAVASLLGLSGITTYEGEAAMQLEQLALRAPERHTFRDRIGIPWPEFLSTLVSELAQGARPETLALRFHQALVLWIEAVVIREDVRKVAFSGGVFQNALLCDLIRNRLSGSCQLYFHRQLSPNDECISFGQLAYFHMIGNPDSGRNAEKSVLSISQNY